MRWAGAVDRFEVLRERLGGARNDGDGEGGLIVKCAAFVQFGDREIEGVAELVLERANDLTAVLQRLRVLD